MKIKPEIFLSSKRVIAFNKVLITGLDESLISYVKDFVINDFRKRDFFIDVSGNYNSGVVGSLFSDKKTLFILSDYPLDKANNEQLSDDQCFLITSTNGKKANNIKAAFTKLKDALVLECYSLNRSAKETTLKHFIEENDMVFSKNVFWYVIENFDNNYVIFIKQLQALALFDKKIDLISDVEKITFVENKIEVNKIFFNIFNNNKLLIKLFNKSINSVSDFYIFLNSTKLYLEIIRGSSDAQVALASFPKYLFAEKDIFLQIYKKLDKKKLVKIYRSLSKVEMLTRKHSDLYSVIGLRFFLNLKKIIIS